MGVRFVIGRAGTGKTRRCFEAIVQEAARDPLGGTIFWIVPKQATFMAERELTCASGLPGYCRVRVASFEQIGEDILGECGGGAIPQVTAAGRQMVLGHLLRTRAEDLKFFNSVARQAGLAAELDATFAEFERCGKDVGDLKSFVGELEHAGAGDPQANALLAKFRDLHLLYDAYTNYLGQDRLDPHRRLAQVLACIEHCKSIHGAQVFVDGFYEFTDFERRTLAGIAKVCGGMEISLLLDPDSDVVSDPHVQPEEMSLFYKTEETYRRLWFVFNENNVTAEKPVLLGEAKRFKNAYLAHAEKNLFSAKVAAARKSEGVEFITAADRRAEVDAAARVIRQWMLEGMRLRDIAVLTRNLEQYAELIDASFGEHGIQYFVDRRRVAAHHPLPQMVRAVFLVALHHWQHDAMMTLLKSGLCGLTLDEADEIENYVLMHRIRGSEWAATERWRYVRKLTRDSEADLPPAEQFELERIDGLRRKVVEPLKLFVARVSGQKDPGLRSTSDPASEGAIGGRKIVDESKLTIRDYILELFELIERFGIRKTMLGWIKETGDLEQRGEHEQVWAELVKLLDQMNDVMGGEEVSAGDFLAILESGLEQFDLALTPATVDQVLVGGVERTRTPAVKGTIVLGLNEGEFPLTPRDQTIFSDGERRVLAKRKMEIDPDTQRRLFDERFLGYVAFTRASEKLVATRTAADDAGRGMMPSGFWKRLRAAFPDAPALEIRRDEESVETIGTPRQLVTRLMRWVREGASGFTPSPGHPGEGLGEVSSRTKGASSAQTLTPTLSRSTGRGGGESQSAWVALYQWLATHECSNDAIDVMRFRAWRALSYENLAELSDGVKARLFASPLNGSVSRIETFATCPFKHFARYGLGLSEREDAEVTSLDLGNVYHGILEQLVGDMVRANKNWGADPKNITEAAINKYARAVGEDLKGELMLSTARNQYLLSHIERTLGQVIESQSAAAARGGFKPLRAELEFGFGSSDGLPALELKTPAGNRLRLRGKIDRVDLLEEQAAFAVIDYKLSGNQLSLDRVYHGISLQLLTYLLVLQANGEKLAGKKLTPAAAFYVKLLRQLDDVKHPDEAVLPEEEAFHLQVKPRGVINREFLSDIDEKIGPGVRSEVVQAAIKKDGEIGFRKNSDAAEVHEFVALLKHVEKRLGELGDQIIAGRIDVLPYRMGLLTPCPDCEYRAVCRFDPLTNRYNQLTVRGREGVLDQLAQEGRDGE